MELYDLPVPDAAVRTEFQPKPEPETDPVDIWEANHLLDFSNVGGGTDRAALFSGGDDSLAVTHLAMREGWADIVVHLETNSSIPANTDYVRRVCEEYQWPLVILQAPMELDTFAYRYGFPGPSQHNVAFNTFKSRALNEFYQHRTGDVKFISGVRQLESDRRMDNIDAEVQYENPTDGGNFRGWWISPLYEEPDEFIRTYREEHNLPRNPVAKRTHRSGDCQCLAFGRRTEELVMIEAEYPEFGEWLRNVERRTQEYRGRLFYLREQYPDVAEAIDTLRKETRPHPMRLTLLNDHYPEVYASIVAIDSDTAVLKGQTDPTSFIGHGGLSSNELRSLTASADENQASLCQDCGNSCASLSPAVEDYVSQAEAQLETDSEPTLTQAKLG